MNKRLIVLGSAWGLSLGAAYLIGNGTHGDRSPAADAPVRQAASPSKSSRLKASSAQPAGSGRRVSSSSAGLRIVAQSEPDAAVLELAKLSDPVARVQGFLALVDSLGPDEFLDVVKAFRTTGMQGEERRTEYTILLHAWGQVDPQGALSYAIENTGTNLARQTVLSSWASYDPDAAIAFAEANHEGDDANPLLVGVIKGMAADNLNRATDLLQSLPRSRERGDALNSMIPYLLTEGIETALTWSNGIADEALRSGAITTIASQLAEDDPARAAELVMTAPEEEARVRAIDDIVEAWASQDLESAIAFTESLDPAMRAEAAEGVVGEIAEDDPVRASDWMASLAANGTNLDPAIRSFVWNAMGKEPELAADWIGQMSSPRDVERTYHHVLGRWMGRDPDAAKAWMSTTELPESIQRRFAERPAEDGR